jgi:hypothetical protein
MYEPILPSSLLEQVSNEGFDLKDKTFNNSSFRCGTVIETIEIDNPLNISKKVPEYNVMVVEQEKEGGINASVYKNCINAEAFGGIGNFLEFKLQASTKPQDTSKKGTTNTPTNDGSTVLLLCLDSNAEKAVIVASLSHPLHKTTLTKEAGQHLEGQYNGINWQVNKDGELTVTFKSATDPKGVPLNKEVGGTFAKMDKTGSIEANDNVGDSIKINKTSKTVDIKAAKNISLTAQENIDLTSSKNTNIKCADLLASISGAAGMNVGRDMNLAITNALNCKAASVNLTADILLKMQGKIIQVKGDLITIDGTLVMIGKGALPAPTALTQYLGTVLGIPVISTVLGPLSTSVFIG